MEILIKRIIKIAYYVAAMLKICVDNLQTFSLSFEEREKLLHVTRLCPIILV